MLVPVARDWVLQQDAPLTFDVYSAEGQKLLPAGSPFSRRIKQRLFQETGLFRPEFQTVVNHEETIYSNASPVLSFEEWQKNRQSQTSQLLIGTESAQNLIQGMASFWAALEAGQKGDVALLEVMNEQLIAELCSSVDHLQFLSQLRVRDEFTYDHTLDVAAMSIALAVKLGFDSVSIREIGLAALLHDVGKLLIPKSIMFKKGRLSQKEFEVMKQHPELGYRMLRHELKLPETICLPAIQHQEMNGGGGYPRNLRGGEIHLYSQIVKIADVYDALTSERPYKMPIPQQKALGIMLGEGERSFEPTLLKAFTELVNHQEPNAEEALSQPAKA